MGTRRRWTTLVAAALCALPAVVSADSMAVPTVTLEELPEATYRLEAVFGPAFAPGARRPQPPARCSVGEPSRSQAPDGVRIAWELECGGEPLQARDTIVLPWTVDGIQLQAQWEGAEPRRALFGRGPSGVVVRLYLVLERRASLGERLLEHGKGGALHAVGHAGHWLFVLSLALVCATARSAVVGIAGLAAGQAGALVAFELGLSSLPLGLADVALSGLGVVVAAQWLRGEALPRAWPASAVIAGFLHGAGLANRLVVADTPPSEQLSALLFENLGVDAAHVVVAALAVALARLAASPARLRFAVPAAGLLASVSFFAGVAGIANPVSRAEPGFLELEPVDASAGASVPTLEVPPEQLDADGELTSPFLSYLVVEPYQVRHEVLVDVEALGAWVEVPVDANSSIPAEPQEELARAATALVLDGSPLRIDGAPLEPASQRADFVELGPTGAVTRETPVDEPLDTAILGVTLVYETASLARTVELEWGLYPEGVEAIPLTVTDPEAVVEDEIAAADPVYRWTNQLEGFELPSIEAISAEPPRAPVAALALASVAAGLFLLLRRSRLALVFVAVAYVSYPFLRVPVNLPGVLAPSIDREQAAAVTERLLVNVYRCFDIHNEEAIYDRLALTVTGDQLLDVYLESRRALELENRGGARVRIDDVVVSEVRSIRRTDDDGYEIEAVWTVGGSVNHFGHVHFRQNRYDATLAVVPVDDAWKIRSVELLEEKRVL